LLALAIGTVVAFARGDLRPFELSVAVAAAIATLAAVVYASDAAREARSLRREERLARLPELVSDLTEALVRAIRTGGTLETNDEWTIAYAKRERLRGSIGMAGIDLPACEALLLPPMFPTSDDERRALQNAGSRVAFHPAVTAAIDELIDAFRRSAR
jgi:hypothetical protein